MKDLIKAHLGAEQFARVEKKADALGIIEIWESATERALQELGADAAETDVVARAAVRAQQRAGVIPRLAPVEESATVQPAPEAAPEAPAADAAAEPPKNSPKKKKDSAA